MDVKMMEYIEMCEEWDKPYMIDLFNMVENKGDFKNENFKLGEALYQILIFGGYENQEEEYLKKVVINNVKIRLALELMEEARKLICDALNIPN